MAVSTPCPQAINSKRSISFAKRIVRPDVPFHRAHIDERMFGSIVTAKKFLGYRLFKGFHWLQQLL